MQYGYFNMLKEFKEPENLRLKLVLYAREHGIKAAARHFACDRNTVQLWLGRYDGKKGSLRDASRAPQVIPHKTPPAMEAKIVELKRKRISMGAIRLKREFDLPVGHNAISRILGKHGLVRKWRKKTKTKNDLRAVKALWAMFEQVCVDTRDLCDIPEYWPLIRMGFPRYQFSAREVVSGLAFTDYAHERSLSDGVLFINRILSHLKLHGVKLCDVTIQGAGGNEFIGSWQSREPSAFIRVVEASGATWRQIPPGARTYQADIETYNGLIESEFLTLEGFGSIGGLLSKTKQYVEYFNVERKNSYKGWKAPIEITRERSPEIRETIASWRPVVLDDYMDEVKKVMPYWENAGKGGEHVPGYP